MILTETLKVGVIMQSFTDEKSEDYKHLLNLPSPKFGRSPSLSDFDIHLIPMLPTFPISEHYIMPTGLGLFSRAGTTTCGGWF